MSWAKLDDGFWMHPKVMAAGNAATGVYARMLSYCGCYLTDGLVPAPIVQTLTASDPEALESLERAGLISRLPETGSVLIPDYLEFNRSKAQIEADRATKQRNGRLGGRPRKGSA